MSAGPTTPNTTVQFSDTVQLHATLTAAAACCGPLTGALLFKINGQPTAGVSSPVNIAAPAAATDITVLAALTGSVLPNGAGAYPITVTFTSTNPGYGNAAGSATTTVNAEDATLTDRDTTVPTVGVVIDQRSPAGDTTFIDYTKTAVWVRFDVYAAGGTVPVQTMWKQATNTSDWALTGKGAATAKLSKALADGGYLVTANLVATNSATIGHLSPYLVGDEAIAAVASTPCGGSYMGDGGFITLDAAANTPNQRGSFAFAVTYGAGGSNPKGATQYTYRTRMDVGQGNQRDVDVRIRSTALTKLTPGQGGKASLTGKYSAQFVDALTGTDYTGLDFGNGTFRLDVVGGASAQYGLALLRPDGSLFHAVQ